jgi:hypothetical protein
MPTCHFRETAGSKSYLITVFLENGQHQCGLANNGDTLLVHKCNGRRKLEGALERESTRCDTGLSSLSKSDWPQFGAGDAICVRHHAYPEQGNVSKIYRSSQRSDASSRRVQIRIHFSNVTGKSCCSVNQRCQRPDRSDEAMCKCQ